MRKFFFLSRSQRGAALLIMMLLLFVVSMAVLLKGLGRRNAQLGQERATTAALVQAKDALIAYAVTYADNYPPTGAGPGHLMCPDTDAPAFDANGLPLPPYGSPNAPCGPNALGRLPHFVTLPSGNPYPLSDYGSGIDQQFWYAVGNVCIATPSGGVNNIFNSTTPGSLTLDGQTDVVAVIIAPGPPLTGQNRPGANVSDYLEAGNASGPNFVSSLPAAPGNFNDKIISIRRSELLSPVTARVAEEIKKQLDAYHVANSVYPPDQAAFAGALTGAPQWLSANNWPAAAITTYTRISNDSATVAFNGCGIIYTLTFGTASLGRSQPHC